MGLKKQRRSVSSGIQNGQVPMSSVLKWIILQKRTSTKAMLAPSENFLMSSISPLLSDPIL